jgi:hypothetical protein
MICDQAEKIYDNANPVPEAMRIKNCAAICLLTAALLPEKNEREKSCAFP